MVALWFIVGIIIGILFSLIIFVKSKVNYIQDKIADLTDKNATIVDTSPMIDLGDEEN